MNPKFFRFLFAGRWAAPAGSALLAAALLDGGCALLRPAKSESHYYLLSAGAPGGAPRRDRTEPECFVRLLPVETADYLNTQAIAVRNGANEINFASNDRWAEPLGAGVRRVLAEDLARAPDIRAVLTDQPRPATGLVYSVSIQIQAGEGVVRGQRGSVRFRAAWIVSGPEPATDMVAHGVFEPSPAGWQPGDYGALAEELSRTVGDLGRTISQELPQSAGRSGP